MLCCNRLLSPFYQDEVSDHALQTKMASPADRRISMGLISWIHVLSRHTSCTTYVTFEPQR